MYILFDISLETWSNVLSFIFFFKIKSDHTDVCRCAKWANAFRGLYIFLDAWLGWQHETSSIVSVSFPPYKNGNLKYFYFLTFQSGEGLDLIIKVKQRPKGSLFWAASLFFFFLKKGGRFEFMLTTTTGFLQHLIWVSHLFTATRRQE
jgi:hypothetical protein